MILFLFMDPDLDALAYQEPRGHAQTRVADGHHRRIIIVNEFPSYREVQSCHLYPDGWFFHQSTKLRLAILLATRPTTVPN